MSFSIHQEVFNKCFDVTFLTTSDNEAVVESKYLIKTNQHLDVSIVCPVVALTHNYSGGLSRGDLAIPLIHNKIFSVGDIDIFLPAGCSAVTTL